MEPYKPGEAEREFYYLGLFDPPKLIARTSGTPWSLVEGPDTAERYPPRKSFRAIIQHEILVRWSESVRSNIIRALDGCNWRCFYPIRIGSRDDDARPPVVHYPVVLMVTVDEIDMEWESAIEIALACREVLRTAGIQDVEVELLQATVTKLAESRKLIEGKVNQEHWFREGDQFNMAAKINEAMLPVHSSLGYHISQAPRGPEGTMGLHLQLDGDKSKTYGLLSRHVAIAGKEKDAMDYKKQDGDQCHLQLAVPLSALEKCQEKLGNARHFVEHLLKPLQRRIDEFRASEWDEIKANIYRPLLQYADSLKKAVDEVYTAGDTGILERTLGHVAFSPTLASYSNSNTGFLRDWALVQLSASQFNEEPENKVYIGYDGFTRSAESIPSLPDQEECLLEYLDGYGFLPIQGTRPWAIEQRQAFRVGKRGRTTRLTFGVVGEIEAILRTPMAAEEAKISWSYLVVAYTTDTVAETGQWTPFSQPGDSGSCVFDHTGRVVGIINGGQESVEVERFGKHYQGVGSTLPPEDSTTSSTPKGYTDFEKLYGREGKGAVDITFVTPIDWILDDIKEFTGYTAKII
ncbi:hypothetical protein MHUMG1_04422 [Metarhizium humberi]|uniref:Uncharacterized protein n=1 Tax=Metarhizium humberi TaxID=2596975 RepID=A0A9P8MC88_9HYPO|nr:hypothetical protein MHUMG1_04422 [Metarhizium humberi]